MDQDGDFYVRYATALRHHSNGYALYHPWTSGTLKPGSIGYFNDIGDWCPMKFESFTALVESMKLAESPPGENWGPLCSKEVKRISADTSGNMCVSYSLMSHL
jgi:hypothetical protein